MAGSIAHVDLRDPDDIADAILHRQPLGLPGETPWELYRALRDQAPIFHSSHGMWILTRYADSLKLLMLTTSDLGARMREQAAEGDVVAQTLSNTMLFLEDPADTMRQRRLVRRAFTRQTVQRLRPDIEELVDGLLEECARRESFDFMNDFADYIPVAVVCLLLGVPSQDIPSFRDWTRDMSPATSAVTTEEMLARLGDAMRGLREYIGALIAEHRKGHGEDLLSQMIRVRDQGDQLSEDELMGLSIMILLAGSDTTTQLMTGAMHALCSFPDQLRTVREDMGLVPQALEELIRHSGPVHYTQPRTLREPLRLGDVEIPIGDTVLAVVAAANRDPAQFEDPDAVDVHRPDVRHLGFSQGMHLCIGAMLARLEAEVALTRALERFPVLELAEDPVPYVDLGPMRGIRALHVQTRGAR